MYLAGRFLANSLRASETLIGPKNNVFTGCKSIVDLDQFTKYSNDNLVTDACGGEAAVHFVALKFWTCGRIMVYRNWSENLPMPFVTVYTRDDSTYFQIPQAVFLEYMDELQRLLSDTNGPLFPIMVPYQSTDGLW